MLLADLVARTGTYVDSRDLTAAWAAASPSGPDAPPDDVAAGRWKRVFAWAIREQQVVVAHRARRVYFAPMGAAHFPLPAEPPAATSRAFGTVASGRANAAVRAMLVAWQRTGAGVTGRQVSAAWPQANGEAVPPDAAGRVQRALEPALADGRVEVERDARHTYYRPSAMLLAQTSVVHDDARRDADRASERVRQSEPEVTDHNARVAEASSSDDRAGGRWPSDMMRVEEAARRAVEQAASAVRLEHIRAALDADPALTLRGRTPLAVLVQRLLTCGRLQRVHPRVVPMELPKRTVYYTVPNGPARVRSPQLSVPDRRLAALHALWRASEGRPVSTTALHRFADARPLYRVEADPHHGWANALQVFERAGAVVRIRTDDPRFVLWAPQAAWAALPDAERARRVQDAFGRAVRGWEAEVEDALGLGTTEQDVVWAEDVPPAATERRAGPPDHAGVVGTTKAHVGGASEVGTAPDASEHDVQFVSRNRDMQALVRATKMRHAAHCGGDDDVRRAVARRPVTAADVEAAASERAHLRPRGVSVARALHEASRLRSGMLMPAVVWVGVVGEAAFYDLPDQTVPDVTGVADAVERPSQSLLDAERPWVPPAATAYVAYRRALAEADAERLARGLMQLQEAVSQDLTGVLPLGPKILSARATVLAGTAAGRAERLEATASAGVTHGVLVRDDVAVAEDLARRLREIAAAARELAIHYPEAAGAAAQAVTELPAAAGRSDATAAGSVEGGAMPEASQRLGMGSALPASEPPFGGAPTWGMVVLDSAVAAQQLAGLVSYRMVTPRELGARIVHSVPTVRPPGGWDRPVKGADDPRQAASAATGGGVDADGVVRAGRGVETYLDRVAFACYETTRFAIGEFGPLMARAQYALGLLRHPQPFVDTIQDRGRKAAHTPALAALGVFDDPASRAVIAWYLGKGCTLGGSGRDGPTSGTALPTAVLALAPKPFGGVASRLAPAEQAALERAAAMSDEYLAKLASRVLRAWAERWERDELLRL